MRLKPDLSVDWVTAFNGGGPRPEDMDAFNHGTEILDGTNFFFLGHLTAQIPRKRRLL